MITESTGIITSPGFESGSYPNAVDCVWNIEVQSGQIVNLEFINISLESDFDCR